MTFFRSRWVDVPAGVEELDPAELAPGFRAAGVACGLKDGGSTDLGLLACDADQVGSVLLLTRNAAAAAPVRVCREQCDRAGIRAAVVNSGNANAAVGERGYRDALTMRGAAAEALGLDARSVAIAETGPIGVPLAIDAVRRGVTEAASALSVRGGDDFARAIMTTDRGPKRCTVRGDGVTISAQAKGAGMIEPRFATMFCFVQTDAAMRQETLDLLTGVCVKRSFDRISVDGQLSTSDTVFALAGGASGVQIEPESPDELRLGEALDALLRQLALEIVADGEGAKRVGRILVQGRAEAVEPVARSIANSPLVKAALHGGDPNFGRILQAAGQAWPEGEPFVADLEVEGRQLVSGGEVVVEHNDMREIAKLVRGPEIEYSLTIPGEGGETEVFFSDLSPAYVEFNSAHST
jgi:glutamate N-acetyltransferase / amino-acid N-acetyltransferase